MNNLEKWRAFVERQKYLGPTVKVLKIDDDTYAILDHEYNFKSVVSTLSLGSAVAIIEHPPQRERPKPQLYLYDFETQKSTVIPDINTGDLDL